MNPKISVIITTYNRYEYLMKAIQSVRNQKYSEKEIIIVDDCSDDPRYAELEHMADLCYIRNTINSGASASRKNGFKAINGDYVIFMDDDDYYTNEMFFSLAVETFSRYEGLSFVSGNADVYMQKTNEVITGRRLPFHGIVDVNKYLEGFQTEFMKPYSTFSTVFPVSIIKNKDVIGMQMFNDSSIYLHTMLYGNPYFLDDVIGHYRVHEANMTKGLNVDFIILNLDEKKNVYSRLKAFSFNKEEWFYRQIKLTTDYFMRETKPQLFPSIKILKWGLNNLKKKKCHFLCDWLFNLMFSFRVKIAQRRKKSV